MKILKRETPINIFSAINALRSVGVEVITARCVGQEVGSPLAQSTEILLDDSADVATAQAILDAFDPVQAQAEIEAEEKTAKEKAAAIEKLADWMQRNPLEAVKLMEAPAKVAVLEGKVAAIEATATVEAE